MEPLRLGIVGPGLIWDNSHRPVLEKLTDRFAIAAFSASSERSRQKVARDFPNAPFFRDYTELAASPAVDAVVVLTPIALNAPVAIAALRAGKDVFMEKPMARSAEEARALAAVARETGRRVFVLEQSAYRPWQPVLDVIHSGEIGDLVMFDRTAHDLFDASDHTVRGYGTTPWRIHPEFPLGTLFDGGHHHIASLSSVFGPPQSVYASCYKVRPEYGECDHVLMIFEYAGGFRGMFSHSDYLGGRQNYFNVRGTEGLIVVDWDQLIVKNREGDVVRTVALPDENAHEAMWRAFAEDVAANRDPSYNIDRALADLLTLDAVDRSIDAHSKVAV